MKLVEWKEGGYSPFNKPCPQGEIWCGGNMVTHGYYEMPEKTAEDFYTDEEGIRWFKTGDIGQFDEDGSLRIIGESATLTNECNDPIFNELLRQEKGFGKIETW